MKGITTCLRGPGPTWTLEKKVKYALTPILFLTTIISPALLTTPKVCAPTQIELLPAEVVAPYVEVLNPAQKGRGAGTVIEVDGEVLVLTAGHVVAGYKVKDAEDLPATISKKALDLTESQPADVIWYSPVEEEKGHDLALLRPRNAKNLKPARLLLTPDIKIGEPTWYIGTPMGEHGRLERSIVASLGERRLNHKWLGTNGCGYFGNSGGGLYVERGGHYHLAGVVTRISGSYPKAMVLSKTPQDILGFLDSYRQSKKGK